MEVINYFSSDRQGHWLAEIGKCDWGAGQFLYKLLKNGELQDYVGENPKVLLLVNDDELVSFCTYAEKDDIQPTDLVMDYLVGNKKHITFAPHREKVERQE